MRPIALFALVTLTGCAARMRPESYTPQICADLKRDAREATKVRTASAAIGTGLAAGGALAELAADSKAATVTLAVGALVAGAIGLAWAESADDIREEWVQQCPYIPLEQQIQ
jgi:predicted MFS family arabinose efflux permease